MPISAVLIVLLLNGISFSQVHASRHKPKTFRITDTSMVEVARALSDTFGRNISFEESFPYPAHRGDTCSVDLSKCLPVGTEFRERYPQHILRAIRRKNESVFWKHDFENKSFNVFTPYNSPLSDSNVGPLRINGLPLEEVLVEKDVLGLKRRRIKVNRGSIRKEWGSGKVFLEEKTVDARQALNKIVNCLHNRVRWEIVRIKKPSPDYIWELRLDSYGVANEIPGLLKTRIDSFPVPPSTMPDFAKFLTMATGVKLGIEYNGPCKSKDADVGQEKRWSAKINFKASKNHATLMDVLDAFKAANPCYAWKPDALGGVINIFPVSYSALDWVIPTEMDTAMSMHALLVKADALDLGTHGVSFYKGRGHLAWMNETRRVLIKRDSVRLALNSLLASFDDKSEWYLTHVGAAKLQLVFSGR